MTNMFSPEVRATTASANTNFIMGNPNHPEVVIWDTAGMEQYKSLNTMYYREAATAVLVSDVTFPTSFQKMELFLTSLLLVTKMISKICEKYLKK